MHIDIHQFRNFAYVHFFQPLIFRFQIINLKIENNKIIFGNTSISIKIINISLIKSFARLFTDYFGIIRFIIQSDFIAKLYPSIIVCL